MIGTNERYRGQTPHRAKPMLCAGGALKFFLYVFAPLVHNVGGLAMPDIETMKHKMIRSMAGSDQTYVVRSYFGTAVEI